MAEVEQLRFLTPENALALREKFGTPFYVYDEATLTRQAKTALEVGTFTGYASLCMAEALAAERGRRLRQQPRTKS